jgi:hypothetical protein
MILKELIPYEVTFSYFINAITMPRKPLPTHANWNVIEVLTSFLEMFMMQLFLWLADYYYYLTYPLMVHHILHISTQLKAYESDPILHGVVDMKTNIGEKFLCYMKFHLFWIVGLSLPRLVILLRS